MAALQHRGGGANCLHCPGSPAGAWPGAAVLVADPGLGRWRGRQGDLEEWRWISRIRALRRSSDA